jgi:two-component system, cell cycle response regulator
MTTLANIFVIDGPGPSSDPLCRMLGESGYTVCTFPFADAALAKAITDHPDLIIIGDGSGAGDAAVAIKRNDVTLDIPVVLMAAKPDAASCQRGLELGFDDVIAKDCDNVEILARLRPLIRLATLHAELRHRATAARSVGVEARDRVTAIVADNTQPVVLVIGDNPSVVTLALAGKAELAYTKSLFEAEDLLTRRNFDAAVVTFQTVPDAALAFCSQIRHNPRLFNLPIVMLASGSTIIAEAYRTGASRVLEQAKDAPILRATILTLVRRQQLRWSIRGAMADSLAEATRDADTGAFSAAFAERYLAERLAHAQSRRSHLTIALFAAPSIDAIQAEFGDAAALHLTQQVGHWITGLLRAEDLVARTGPHEFCAILPDTPLAEAEVVMHRIAGILAYSDFAVEDVFQPIKVWVRVGATQSQPDDDVATLLARARQQAR